MRGTGEGTGRGEAHRHRPLLIALSAASTLPRAAACRLAATLDDWSAGLGPEEVPALAARLGLTPEAVRAALALLPRAGALARQEEDRARELGARVVTRADPDYPGALADLALPPPALYLQGALPSGPGVAVVGSRRAGTYGREIAGMLGRELAAAGAPVISGFARGIDAAAHRGALSAAGGRTVAVLGAGLGVDYPRGHRRLGREIAQGGALVSEFPVGREPRGWHFPVRNRIIAALAQVTVVVQAAARSGALITARLALEMGREVGAVPGSVFDDRSLGPHALIRDGALLVQHPRDVLELLDPPLTPAAAGAVTSEEPEPGAAPTPGEALLAALPPGEERTADALAAALGEGVDRVLPRLLEAELAGRVRRLPGGAYCRRL